MHPRFESDPSFTALNPHEGKEVVALVALKDGSFLSCSTDGLVKRWHCSAVNKDDNDEDDRLRIVGIYRGHGSTITCAIEKDDDTIITGARDRLLKVWNKTTCECLRTVGPLESEVMSILKYDKSILMCGLYNGQIKFFGLLRAGFRLVRSVSMGHLMTSFCKLEDDSFVILGYQDMQRRLKDGTQLQPFRGNSGFIHKVIELKQDVLVSVSVGDQHVKIWRVETGECLRTLTQHTMWVRGLVKLKEGYFATGSKDKTIRVWDDEGHNITTYQTECSILAMTRLEDGSIVVGDNSRIEIRKQ